MARTALISIRVEPSLKEAVERAAEHDKRSVASYLELMIIANLERPQVPGDARKTAKGKTRKGGSSHAA